METATSTLMTMCRALFTKKSYDNDSNVEEIVNKRTRVEESLATEDNDEDGSC